MRIAIVGAGTIGASWAALFLAHGHQVCVTDPAVGADAALLAYIDRAWPAIERLHGAGAPRRERLTFESELTTALSGADFVQENVPERLELKRSLLARIDAHLPADVIIASSTSGLLMSDMQRDCAHPERCVIGHPFNPPHLIPLVEVVGGRLTNPHVVDRAVRIYSQVGKTPIRLAREVPGHVANRLQAAVWREAIHLVQAGVVSVGDVDLAMTEGPGLRWALQGPHMTFHLGGGGGGLPHFLTHILPAMTAWWQDLGEPEMTGEVKERLIAGVEQVAHGRTIEQLRAERDAGLIEILETRLQASSRRKRSCIDADLRE